MHKWLIVYSSVTGNTKQIAEAMYGAFAEGEADIISIREIGTISLDDYDYIAVGYWLTRGAPDKAVQKFLAELSGKTVVLFQTHGAEVGSEHAVTAFARAAAKLGEGCDVLGTFSSQGRINPALLSRRQNSTDKNDPHAANERNKKRWENAAKHPDENDLQRAKDFVFAMKHKLALREKYRQKANQ
ncbi:flavodoxin family protein [Megamonas hypermegale]|uniref:Flavodoxin family protein n=1 Tax=Megamonas hypermegale TaxID=158847 RepID=A0A921HMC7_9FIRM|nr:flavodoxin family protein [Megamonas hypermegale]HJF84257.1 flavodoxin family protein [Megamonas hypermegale]